MDRETCLLLINLYKNQRPLWDSRNKDYYHGPKRENSWKEISNSLNMPVAELKTKMKSLMGSYRREKSRQKQSQGRSGKSVYRSKWFAFDSFDFLADRSLPDQVQDTIVVEPDMLDLEEVDGSENEEFPAPNTSHIERNFSGQEKRTFPQPNARLGEDIASKALALLEKSVDVNTDTYFTFGQYVANELRKYDPDTLAIVKQSISSIIFEADTGRLSSTNFIYNRPSYTFSDSTDISPEFSTIEDDTKPIILPILQSISHSKQNVDQYNGTLKDDKNS